MHFVYREAFRRRRFRDRSQESLALGMLGDSRRTSVESN